MLRFPVTEFLDHVDAELESRTTMTIEILKKFLKHNLIIVSSCFVFNACTWMGSPKVPKPDVPNQFRSKTSAYTPVKNLPYLAWWQRLNDPELNTLIDTGLNNNLDIHIALSNLEQAKGQLKQIRLSWIPFVNGLGGYSSNPGFGDPGVFFGIFPQYLLNIAKLVKQQSRAEYTLKMTQATVDAVRLTVIAQVSGAYLTLIALQEQLHLYQVLANDLNEIISLLNSMIEIGLRDEINIAQYIVAEKEVQAQINLVQNNIVLSQNALHYLLNQNPGTIKSKNNFASLDFDVFKPGNLPSTVLQNRPDLLAAENSVKASHSNVGVAYGELFPEIDLGSFFGLKSGNGSFGPPNKYGNFNDAYLNWGINPATFGLIDARKGAYHASVYQYIQTVRKILKDVDNSYSTNLQFSHNYHNIRSALDTQNSKYGLQVGLFQFGLISYVNLLVDKVDVDTLALLVNQSKLQFAMSVVSLYQELAGGYKYTHEVKKSQ